MNFENYLKAQHAKQYSGLDDDMQHDFEMWIADLDSDEMIEFADEWKKDTVQECYNECLAVECGEGECGRAIRTKFNLKKYDN